MLELLHIRIYINHFPFDLILTLLLPIFILPLLHPLLDLKSVIFVLMVLFLFKTTTATFPQFFVSYWSQVLYMMLNSSHSLLLPVSTFMPALSKHLFNSKYLHYISTFLLTFTPIMIVSCTVANIIQQEDSQNSHVSF